MGDELAIARRSVLLGAAGAAATGVVGALPADAAQSSVANDEVALWRTAFRRGILFGSSTATWQLSDKNYARLFGHEAAILFTQDDLLWYRLKPTPASKLDFTFGDQIIDFAERHHQLVFGAHLVWDEGFGDGWTDDDLWGLDQKSARRLLYGTVKRVVRHYRGRVAAWSVANEVTDPKGKQGLRTNVPWYNTIGPGYVARAFHIAHEEDRNALLVINEFGFETVNQYGDQPADRQRATLQVIDRLLNEGVPVHALGIQAHLQADHFADRFHPRAYRRFLAEVADRGLKILITELDVLDDGLPANATTRDRMVAETYQRYLDVAVDEPAVAAVMAFGLSDRYTWLQEDYPREDGAPRRALAYNQKLQPKRARNAISHSLRHDVRRWPTWNTPRHVSARLLEPRR